MSFIDYLTEAKTKKVKKRRIFVDPLFVLRSHNIKIKSFKTKKIDNLTYYVQTSNLNY